MRLGISFAFILIACVARTQNIKLENALGAVVTVVVEKTSSIGKKILGHRGGVVEEAYERSLILSNALGSGSGFIIQRNGKKYVVTNAHVIESASDDPESIFIYTYRRNKHEVRLVGGDSFYDVAVLEFLEPPEDELHYLEFTDKMPFLTQKVFAIGNPLGEYPYTVTDGIISAINRMRDGITGKFGYIQTTATMIWGNSGGPLVDEEGKVVGINSQIAFATGPDGNTYLQQQLNFSLEPLLSNKLINDIINTGKVTRAYMGIEVSQKFIIDSTPRGYTIGKAINDNPIISGLIPGSEAANKLKGFVNWNITHINDRIVENVEEVLGEFEKVKPNEVVSLKLKKDQISQTVNIQADLLEHHRLEQIAEFVISQNKNISLDASTAQLKLNLPTVTESKKLYWKDTPENNNERASYFVLAGGISSQYQQDIWRITTLGDLGALLKIYGLRGGIEYYVSSSQADINSIKRITQNFSGDDSVFQTTLWY